MAKVQFGGLVALFLGLAMLVWFIRMYRDPGSIAPDSGLYRWIYNRFYSWGQDWDSQPELSRNQIKRYAVGGLMISAFLIVVGVLSLFS